MQVDRAIEMEGWKLLLLCRLSPLIPYNLLNVAMASTKIHFWPFAIVSFFGEPAPFCQFAAIVHVMCADARPHGLHNAGSREMKANQLSFCLHRDNSRVRLIHLHRCD